MLMAALGGSTACFVATDTLGLPCADADACDPGQRCEAEVCVAAPDNLLTNASFEEWNDAGPTGWSPNHVTQITESMDTPHSGGSAIRIRGEFYASVGQSMSPEQESWPQATRFEARAWTRHIAGDVSSPTLELRLLFMDGTDTYAYGSLPQLAGAQWLELVATIEAAKPVSSVELRMVVASGELDQTLEFDDASVSILE